MLFIKNIKLLNFRCYNNCSFEFEKKINIFEGINASGKTSLAESISYVLIGKSFRTNKDLEVITTGEKYFSLICDLHIGEKTKKIVVYQDEKGKKININGELIKKISDFIIQTGLVCFTPDDLKIVKGSPIERRKFLDYCLSQLNPEYLNILQKYNKILKERNEFLKDKDYESINLDFIEVINSKILEYGVKLINFRDDFILELNNHINAISKRLTNDKELIKIIYLPKVDADKYKKELENRLKHDIYLETTTVGPHRDDFDILINEQTAFTFASQGQARSCVLSFKIGFYQMLKEKGKPVAIILDDVLSELDQSRQNNIFSFFDDDQTFITCTSLSNINKNIIEKSNVIHIGKD